LQAVMRPATIDPEKIPPMAHVVLIVVDVEEFYAPTSSAGWL
jgi:hypothetical protein